MDHPLGTYTKEIVWIRNCVGVWRFECNRCGLVVQTKEGESTDRVDAAQYHHVCDPSKKTGLPAFDPNAPFTFAEKVQEILDRPTPGATTPAVGTS